MSITNHPASLTTSQKGTPVMTRPRRSLPLFLAVISSIPRASAPGIPAQKTAMAPRAVGLALLASVTAVAFAGCASADTASSMDTPISAESSSQPSTEETAPAAAPVEESEQDRIWRICYDPSGNATQVNTNPAVIDEVLSDYPPEWSSAAPVPTAAVEAICHQAIPDSGIKDTWWVHFTELEAGYQAAVAWKAQLDSAGAVGTCREGMDLSNGPSGTYFCGYDLPSGYGAAITNGNGAVDLRIQSPIS